MKLYVGNLANETTERDLSLLFSAHGAVKSVEIVRDPRTGESRRFAFVEMGNVAESTAVMSALDGTRLHDRPLKILRGFIPPDPPELP